MFKLVTSAFCLALMAATPAYAQSAFVMVIGNSPDASPDRAERSATRADLIERAIEEACVRPSSRDLKMQQLYRECAAEMRAELTQSEQAPQLVAAR